MLWLIPVLWSRRKDCYVRQPSMVIRPEKAMRISKTGYGGRVSGPIMAAPADQIGMIMMIVGEILNFVA